jgi:hypothetical protein
MSYNGSGTFQINSTGQPVVSGTVISSTAFNALTADLATGLSTAITKDGQTATTARIPFAQGINSTLVTDSTSTTTGSIITAGGAGVAKALFVGTTANVAGAVTLQSTLGVTGITTFSAQPIFSSLTASSAVATDASKGLVSVTNTGTGNNVLATSPTLTGTIAGASLSLSSLTSGRVPYATTAGLLTDSANLLYSGTDLGVYGLTVGRGAGAVAFATAFGVQAVNGANTGSVLGVGYQAAFSNTSGEDNTAIGSYRPLYSNTTGSSNTAVGREALSANTTASNNTAVGYQAGYSNTTGTPNTFIGYQAGYTNSTGTGNTCLGDRAGNNNGTGSNNTILGGYCGYATTGSSNTFIGNESGYQVTTGAKNTILGRYNGNQGSLDIRTSSNNIVLSDGDGNPKFYIGGSNSTAFFRTEVGVARGLQCDPNEIYPSADNVMSLGLASFRWSVVYAATALINTSDANLKQDIASLDDVEKRVAVRMKSLIKKYRFKNSVAEKGEAARIHIGVIAQEVQAAFVAEGLDPARYALFCSDTWYEVDGKTSGIANEPFTQATPNAVSVTQLGIRYDELLAFVISAM